MTEKLFVEPSARESGTSSKQPSPGPLVAFDPSSILESAVANFVVVLANYLFDFEPRSYYHYDYVVTTLLLDVDFVDLTDLYALHHVSSL